MKLDIERHSGSLIMNMSLITSSFDISNSGNSGVINKLARNDILNHACKQFRKDYSTEKSINIINGLGVTLGDSIIGIGALDYIKNLNRDIKITVIRPQSCQKYVEDVYSIASRVIDRIEYMPYDIGRLPKDAVNIDIGNQLYWEDFNVMEMHDFFLKNIGINYKKTPNIWKKNHWLQRAIPKHKNEKYNYAIFCPNASTVLRSIPEKHHYQIVEHLHRTLKLPVVGFSDVQHPAFSNVMAKCRNTYDFIKIIAQSSYVYTCDSSALHIAAGYDIPTTCIFTAIRPELRSKYYTYCESIYIGDALTERLHESECPIIIDHIHKKYEEYYENL